MSLMQMTDLDNKAQHNEQWLIPLTTAGRQELIQYIQWKQLILFKSSLAAIEEPFPAEPLHF